MFQSGNNGEKVEKKRRRRVGYNSMKVDENLTMFRPAQIFVRTALEMVMWDEINHFDNVRRGGRDEDVSVNALGIFMTQKFTSTVFEFKKVKNTTLDDEVAAEMLKEGSGIAGGNNVCESEKKGGR